jgi:hypothetical protein
MRRLSIVAVAVALSAVSAPARAQEPGIELIPFAGYRMGGGMSSISGISQFDTQDTYSIGAAIDKPLSQSSSVEIYWGHFTGDIDATFIGGLKATGTLTRDDIMLNGIWYAYRAVPSTRPYFTAGLGASIMSPKGGESVGRFAWNVGAGVRHEFGPKLGFRLDGRWVPTWITTGSSPYCYPYYGCYTMSTGEFYDQFEVSLGLVLKIGG